MGAISVSALFTHPWRIVLVCPTVSLEGTHLRDKLASRGTKKQNEVARWQRNFQEQKEGRSKDSRCSQLLTEPLILLLRTECFMCQPDHDEGDKAS